MTESADRFYKSAVALVTGGNRGLGLAFSRALIERGASVVVGARSPGDVDLPGARVIPLDVTDPDQVARLPELVPDVTMLINNAGVHLTTDIDSPDCVDVMREAYDVNVFGLTAVTAALQERLVENRGVIVNVLSAGAWLSGPGNLAYSSSKAAALSVTNSTRSVLGERGVQVVSVHAGFIDTDMMASFPGAKLDPADVATRTLDAVAAGHQEVLIDRMSVGAKAAAADPVSDFTSAAAKG